MSLELDIYKKNKINELNKLFNNNLKNLNYILILNIKAIQQSRINIKFKQQLINNLIYKFTQA